MEVPHFVIDLCLWAYHSPKEKSLLIKQLELALAEIRKHASDNHLILASVPEDIDPVIKKLKFTGQVLSNKFSQPNMILLDPNADETLLQVQPKITYLLGGIVDKSRRIKTHSLWYSVPRKKIELQGSIIGVPDRLNLLIEILIKNSKGTPMEDAILQNMPRREKSERARMELDRGKSQTEISSLLRISESEVKRIIQR